MRHLPVALLIVSWQVSAAAPEPIALNVREFSSVITSFCVRQAIGKAARRLQDAKCARVLEEFSDADGRPLAKHLADSGLNPDEYLTRAIWFYEGNRETVCNHRFGREAVTRPGSHVVFICSDRFMDTREREITIIHEMLHTLGLGENPPSSREITNRVAKRCGG